MKKLGFLLVIACLTGGAVSAQMWGYGWTPPQTVTVEGTLQLQNGQIVLSSGSTVYFIPVLVRYIGFIEGLREGARISVEGYANGSLLQPTKFTIGGKTYDLTAPANTPGAAYCPYAQNCPYGGICGGYCGGSFGRRGAGFGGGPMGGWRGRGRW
jgi:hypothetical protein